MVKKYELLLGRLHYSIVASSEMSGSVCLNVYMCTLPWPNHSRLNDLLILHVHEGILPVSLIH